jgi:hypothetical protein
MSCTSCRTASRGEKERNGGVVVAGINKRVFVPFSRQPLDAWIQQGHVIALLCIAFRLLLSDLVPSTPKFSWKLGRSS